MRALQDLVKKKILHKVTEEHGLMFQDRLAASIGTMLGMAPEPPPPRDSVMIFKFVAAAEGSVDFWRQLAAGMVIGRYAKAWVARKKAERVKRAEAERRSAIADPLNMDLEGSLLTTLPGDGGGPPSRKDGRGKSQTVKDKAPKLVEDEGDAAGRDIGDGDVEEEKGGGAEEDETEEGRGIEEEKERGSEKPMQSEEEGIAEAPKKEKRRKDKKQKGAREAEDTVDAGSVNKEKVRGVNGDSGKADALVKERPREGSSGGGLNVEDEKADKKKKKRSKKSKDKVRPETQSACCVQ